MNVQVVYPSQITSMSRVVGFDIETKIFDNTHITMMSFFDKANQKCYVVPVDVVQGRLPQKELDYLKQILTEIKPIGHYLHFDLSMIKRAYGIEINPHGDTFILARMLQEQKQGLKDLLAKYITRFNPQKFNEAIPKDALGEAIYDLTNKQTVVYSGLDAYGPVRLEEILLPKLSSRERDIYQLELDFMREANSVRVNGFLIDKNVYDSTIRNLQADYDSQSLDFFQKAGRSVKINSSKDLQKLLFTELGLPETPVRTSKGLPSTNEEALSFLADTYPIARQLKSLKSLDSQLRASIKASDYIESDGHLRCKVEQIGFDGTSRVYTKDTSINQLPKPMRECMVASPGKKFFYFDLCAAELYLSAYMANQTNILTWYKNNEDLHTKIAGEILGRAITSPEERNISKAVVFASTYGSEGAAVSRKLKISQQEGENYVKLFFQKFANIGSLRADVQNRAQKNGYTETLMGRRRKLDFNSWEYGSRDKALRQAFNTCIQGGLADFAKVISHRLGDLPGVTFKFTIFDSFLVEVDESMTKEQMASMIDKVVDFDTLFPGFKFNYHLGVGSSFGEAQRDAD